MNANYLIYTVQYIALMNKLSEYETIALKRLGQAIQDGNWSNSGLVQLIELAKEFLNPIPMQEYANNHGLTYNGLKKQNKAVKLFNQKFIIDND